jgi:ABC-type glutathione transport system ATPase component
MTQGEIVEAGPTERVPAKPEHAYTRRRVRGERWVLARRIQGASVPTLTLGSRI